MYYARITALGLVLTATTALVGCSSNESPNENTSAVANTESPKQTKTSEATALNSLSDYSDEFHELDADEMWEISQQQPLDFRAATDQALVQATGLPISFETFKESFKSEGLPAENYEHAVAVVNEHVDFGYNAIQFADRYSKIEKGGQVNDPRNAPNFDKKLAEARFTNEEVAAAKKYNELYFQEHGIDWQDHANSYAENWWGLYGNSGNYTSDDLRNDMLADGYTPEQADEAVSQL